MAVREARLTGETHAVAAMRRVLDVMREETTTPIVNPQRSLGGLIGGEAKLVDATGRNDLSTSLMGTVQTDAVARAMAVLERSATMGVIVAAPRQAPRVSCPAACWRSPITFSSTTSRSWTRSTAQPPSASTSPQAPALPAPRAAAEAEVGSAAAMAAAALVQMLGGTPEQALDASSIALSNLLGLVCDPVGGLVEVPCQNRNAIGVAAAFSSAQLALAGIKSLVPFDQMAHVMLSVGHALPATLRETAKGGIAQAPAALSACAKCGVCG